MKLLQKTISVLKVINNKGGMAVPIIVILICVIVVFRYCYHSNFNSRFTIGTPVSISLDAHLIKILTYKYKVNGKWYEDEEPYQGGEIGKLFYVKYSFKDPKISDFLEEKPVHDSSIKEAPPDGWEKLPE
jgi:hypothetical protein